jgi:hypothetical protein
LLTGSFCTRTAQRGLCALFMAAEIGDVSTVEVLLSFQPDLSIKEAVSLLFTHPY